MIVDHYPALDNLSLTIYALQAYWFVAYVISTCAFFTVDNKSIRVICHGWHPWAKPYTRFEKNMKLSHQSGLHNHDNDHAMTRLHAPFC